MEGTGVKLTPMLVCCLLNSLGFSEPIADASWTHSHSKCVFTCSFFAHPTTHLPSILPASSVYWPEITAHLRKNHLKMPEIQQAAH